VGEPLDQQRVVVGGMVVAVRRVITRNRESMAVATLEDLQGTLDVVVLPRTYAETGPVWREDAVLLVAGRVDHKGEETVVLADTVWTWEDAVARGTSFGQEVLRRSGEGRGRRNGNGNSRWSCGSGARGVDDRGGPPGVLTWWRSP
jgi:DNA polymerase III alpha subunit